MNIDNELELKPCPFCGTEVKMRKVPLFGYQGCFEFEVRCPRCGCTVDYINNNSLYRTEEEAVVNVTKKWNDRVETKMTVTECGAKYGKLLKKAEVKRKQYMKYVVAANSYLAASEINKELENGAKVISIIPLLKTDNWGSYTAGYNVLFEKEEEE